MFSPSHKHLEIPLLSYHHTTTPTSGRCLSLSAHRTFSFTCGAFFVFHEPSTLRVRFDNSPYQPCNRAWYYGWQLRETHRVSLFTKIGWCRTLLAVSGVLAPCGVLWDASSRWRGPKVWRQSLVSGSPISWHFVILLVTCKVAQRFWPASGDAIKVQHQIVASTSRTPSCCPHPPLWHLLHRGMARVTNRRSWRYGYRPCFTGARRGLCLSAVSPWPITGLSGMVAQHAGQYYRTMS
jgi:hypothetical protein